ncbi:MAG: ribosomal protein S18-alanine N-acetyltransferase [Clostridia bacterium]
MIRQLTNKEQLDNLIKLEENNFGQERWNRQMLLSMFANPCNDIYGVFLGEILIGYACLNVSIDFCNIDNIVVDKPYVCRGYGSQLLELLIKKARDYNTQAIFLEVNTQNLNALKLYGKYGFEVISTRKNFYSKPLFDSKDAYVMVKKL